jgi:formamidopyrimidine-DNA glycosylase
LPEVEVTRLSFADRIAGARGTGVRVGKPLRWPLGCEPESLIGRHVLGVRRRGKYLLVDLDEGLLLWHLGMSGSLLFGNDRSTAQAHDHFDLNTTQGLLRLNEAVKLLGHLGVEPLNGGFELAAFHQGLRKRKSAIKQVLLAGELVVGVGNIYASEALFLAGIRPTTRADRISRPRAEKLRMAVMDVLARAVKKGGSTLRDFSAADGKNGYFQLEAHVYDRVSEPCRVCGTSIRRIQQGQRSTYYCPVCQKP